MKVGAIIAIGVLVCAAMFGAYLWLRAQPPHALGCTPSDIDWQSVSLAQAPSVADLPEAVDWRNEFTPEQQGGQASCVAQAVRAAMGRMLSAAFIYNQRTTSNCKRDAGMSIYNALAILQVQGDCLEILMPYDPANACTQPDAAARADAARRRISGYGIVFAQQGDASLDVLRGLIAAGRAPILAVPVYTSFFDNAAGTIAPHVDGERFYGGHAMLLVGYDSGGFWALNSWGATWGHDGFAYLSNEFVQCEAWEGWIMDNLLGAPTTLFVDVVDPAGALVLGGSLMLLRDGVIITTKANVGGTVQFDTRTAGRYCVKPLPPADWQSDSQVECLVTGDRLRFVWRRAAIPTPTATRTWTPTPTRTVAPTWTATPTRIPTVHPTGETPMPPTPPFTTPTVPMPPTPDAAPQWAVVSYWGQWGLVGERQPAGLQFLSVPREHWPVIRRAVYLAQGGALPQYDTWAASKLGYAMAQAELGAVLTPIVIVECGDTEYLCVGTAAGILVMTK